MTEKTINCRKCWEETEIPIKALKDLCAKTCEEITQITEQDGGVWKVEMGEQEYLLFENECRAVEWATYDCAEYFKEQIDAAFSGSSITDWLKDRILADDEALREWAEESVGIDGWQHRLAFYDGTSIDLEEGYICCRVN